MKVMLFSLPFQVDFQIKDEKILETYGMDKYDTFELLKKIGGKLPIDNFQFIGV
ncbi:MAG: hypothetical protein SOY42_09910 [Clostridium sp.]|nr:hypothetical protein [Clostridium sp.]